jgi:O-antigen/teichoic acid export membrane protein
MKRWFSDGAFRSILRNAAYLGSGSVASALLGLLALSCAGKGMSPEMFGVLVVIQAYTKAVSDFIKFQTWQFVVQFGTPALEHQNTGRFRDVVAFSFGLDIASGVIAVLGGMIMLPFLSHSLGLDRESFWLAMLYCTLIPSMTSSTPTGVLRAFNRFDLIAIQQAIKPFLQAVGSVISYYFDLGFPGFIVTWYASNLIGGTLFWWFTARELRRRDIHGALRPRLFNVARRIEGAWNFVWTTNIAHTIWAARNSCTTVLVGVVLGPAAAGLFKIAMTFFDATGTPAKLLEKSFYPEIMRLDPRTKTPWLLGLRSSLLAGGIGLAVAVLMLLVGKPLISAVFGQQYLEAYDLIQIMLGAIIVSMMGFPQESLLFMAGKQRAFLIAQATASAAYIALLVSMAYAFGVQGAAFAYLLGQCLDVLLSLIPTIGAYRNRFMLGLNVPKESNQ